jgi:hypothetical protein
MDTNESACLSYDTHSKHDYPAIHSYIYIYIYKSNLLDTLEGYFILV